MRPCGTGANDLMLAGCEEADLNSVLGAWKVCGGVLWRFTPVANNGCFDCCHFVTRNSCSPSG